MKQSSCFRCRRVVEILQSFFEPCYMLRLFTFQPGQSLSPYLLHSSPYMKQTLSSHLFIIFIHNSSPLICDSRARPLIPFFLLHTATTQIEVSSSSKILLHTIQCWNIPAKLLSFYSSLHCE